MTDDNSRNIIIARAQVVCDATIKEARATFNAIYDTATSAALANLDDSKGAWAAFNAAIDDAYDACELKIKRAIALKNAIVR